MLYGDMVGVTALVDAGATHTVLPTSFLRELGVQPDMKVQVAYADGEIRETDSGQARIAYNGVERVCPYAIRGGRHLPAGRDHAGNPEADGRPGESRVGVGSAHASPAVLANEKADRRGLRSYSP